MRTEQNRGKTYGTCEINTCPDTCKEQRLIEHLPGREHEHLKFNPYTNKQRGNMSSSILHMFLTYLDEIFF